MQILQQLKKTLPVVGIYPNSCSDGNTFSAKIIIILIFFGKISIFVTAFLIFKARTMREFSESIYTNLTLYTTILVSFEFGRKVLKLIRDFDSMIEKRKNC